MAVYTEVSDEEVAAFAGEYDLGAVTALKGIAEGVENSNYLLVTERGQYILTLYERRVAERDLPFFLGLMEHLADRGIACPLPLHDRKGRALKRLAGRPAVIVTFLEGMWPRRIQPRHCAALGEALARMHLAGSDFPMTRRNNLSVDAWRPLFERCRDRADELVPGLAEGIEAATPRETLRHAFRAGWLTDEAAWLQMLRDRNETSHLYDEETAGGAALTKDPHAVTLDDVAGRVEYDDVSFTYENDEGGEEAVLHDISFTAEPGEMVGLVGPTGAGKTTLMKLLMRLYDVDEGAVRIDGTDVRDLSLSSLRDAVGYVSQEPFLFYGTVRENIAYATPEASDEDVEAAARMAGAHEFIGELPDGYDTLVGERGVKLSGGQRQRVSIARAVLRDPEILLLDEATSHVDNETEVVIQHNLAELVADRTTFAIAHRLSTVRDADTILVLEDGELVESGHHEELLAEDGLYATLWRVQVGEVDQLPDEFLEGFSAGRDQYVGTD